MLLGADLTEVYRRVGLELNIKRSLGFVLPAGIQRLSDAADIDLAVGVHYFYTSVENAEPSYHICRMFHERSDQMHPEHRFHGSALSADREHAGQLSAHFAKLIGISFMAEHAGTTWFSPLDRHWITGFETAAGCYSFGKKNPRQFGPDYLAADYDPRQSASGPLYALEFKGAGGNLKFSHNRFQRWRHQAVNIQAVRDEVFADVKSWLLAFNYACTAGRGRAKSAILVEDPSSEPGAEDRLRALDAEGVIREHLARQCRKLG